MTTVIGVDGGAKGAFARWNGKELDIIDIPHWYMQVGKGTRARFDVVGIYQYFQMAKLLGVELVGIETVGQRPHNSGMFAFGYGMGLVVMGCVAARLPIETANPRIWKRLLKCPGKYSKGKIIPEAENAIIARAEELFPDYRELFRGERGGKRVDRAEAAMIAKYTRDHLLNGLEPDPEKRFAYQMETGE